MCAAGRVEGAARLSPRVEGRKPPRSRATDRGQRGVPAQSLSARSGSRESLPPARKPQRGAARARAERPVRLRSGPRSVRTRRAAVCLRDVANLASERDDKPPSCLRAVIGGPVYRPNGERDRASVARRNIQGSDAGGGVPDGRAAVGAGLLDPTPGAVRCCAVLILEALQAGKLPATPVLLDEREAGTASRTPDATRPPPRA